MELTYDPEVKVAYLRLKRKRGKVRTVCVSDELNIDLAADGSVYGIELLNANEQMGTGRRGIRWHIDAARRAGRLNEME